MRTSLVIGAFALFSLAAANAQMCGAGQQAQASTPAQGGGMMCGAAQPAVDDPMADKPAQKSPTASGMCACCKNMAMMGNGGSMQHSPGMDMK